MNSIECCSQEVNTTLHKLDLRHQSWAPPKCCLATQPTALKNDLTHQPRRIFIVEGEPLFLKVLRQILDDAADLMVCGTAGAADQVLPAIARTEPDLVLADIDLLGNCWLDLIKKVRSLDPSVKILIISAQNVAIYAARVLRLGGDGYMLKQDVPIEIVCAVHDILEGHIYVSEEVMESSFGEGRSRTKTRSKKQQNFAA